MFQAILRAFGQLPDPALRNVLLISSASALALLVVSVSLASWGLSFLTLLDWSWANTALQLLGGLLTFLLAWLLFPTVVGLLSGLWSEKIARAVEARHYRTLPAPLDNPLRRDIISGLRLAGWSLALNLLILPLYLFLPGVNLLIFCLANGFLLAREYFSQVAMRRLDDAALAHAWRQNRGRLWLSGMLLAFFASIPLLNLLTPILGTAFMVHVFEDLRRQRRLS